jgi:hypothetical protein
MRRRDFLQGLAASSIVLLFPEHLLAQSVLRAGNDVSLRCLGNVNGPRFLDGRTRNATVGLAPDLSKTIPEPSGTSSAGEAATLC